MRFMIPIFICGTALAAPVATEIEALIASPADEMLVFDAGVALSDPSKPIEEVLDVQVFEFDDTEEEND